MSRARFLADHDFNEHILDGLRRREPGIEIIRAREVGLQEASDSDVLEYAATQRLLVLSHDVNTMPAAAYKRIESGRQLTGVLIAHQALNISRVVDDVALIWSASELEEWNGAVWFLPL